MDTWSRRVTAKIGESVKVLRNERGWSAEQLAEHVRQLDVPITRAVVTDLENGRRSSISISELLAIGYVLRVPPLSLWLSELPDGTVEALPGIEKNQLDTALWVVGISDLFRDELLEGPVYPFQGFRVQEDRRFIGTDREDVDLRISQYLVPYIFAWQKLRDTDSGWISTDRIDVEEPTEFLARLADLLSTYEQAKEAGFTITNPLQSLGFDFSNESNEEASIGDALEKFSRLNPQLKRQLVEVLTRESGGYNDGSET